MSQEEKIEASYQKMRAVELSIESIQLRITALKARVERNQKEISGPRSRTLERGLFYTRHINWIEEDEATIKELEKALDTLKII